MVVSITRLVFVFLCFCLMECELAAQLRTALEVRSLPAEEAREEVPVDMQGVVVFIDPPKEVFIQDATAGTFFRLAGRVPPRLGDEVRVTGVTDPGLYLPGITRAEFTVIGHPGLPEPVEVSFDDLISGRFHYQRVVVEGIVRRVMAESEGRTVVRLAVGSRLIEVRVETPTDEAESWVDSRVRVTGLVVGELNLRRQLVVPYLRCRDWSDLDVIDPPRVGDDIPVVSPEQVLNFAAGGQELRRVKLRGEVLAAFPEGELFLRSEETGIAVVRGDVQPRLKPGDLVEVMGFPEMDRFSARLVDAVVVERSSGELTPEALAVTLEQLRDGEYDGNLISVIGEVVEQYRTERGGTLVLRDGLQNVRVDLPEWTETDHSGAKVRVTGIAVVEATRRSFGYRSEPDRIRLRLRSLDDLAVVREPPWWTARRLAIALVVFCLVSVVAGLWITLLQRQVRRQTGILRRQIEREAILEERQRLAREFHDTLEQELAGLSLRLDAAAARGLDETLRGFIDDSRNLVSRIQVETRNLVSDLRQDPDESGDLVAALEELVAHHRGLPLEIVMESVRGGLPMLPSRTVHHLKMIAQESITNAIKHAEASRLVVAIIDEGEELRLSIRDDGKGFDAPSETIGKSGHFGCMGIRERCQKIGAKVEWQSAPGKGCEVRVTLTLPRK